MLLNETVEVAVPSGGKMIWRLGILVGRTLAAEPRYDVRLATGEILVNVPEKQVRAADHSVPLRR